MKNEIIIFNNQNQRTEIKESYVNYSVMCFALIITGHLQVFYRSLTGLLNK